MKTCTADVLRASLGIVSQYVCNLSVKILGIELLFYPFQCANCEQSLLQHILQNPRSIMSDTKW